MYPCTSKTDHVRWDILVFSHTKQFDALHEIRMTRWIYILRIRLWYFLKNETVISILSLNIYRCLVNFSTHMHLRMYWFADSFKKSLWPFHWVEEIVISFFQIDRFKAALFLVILIQLAFERQMHRKF